VCLRFAPVIGIKKSGAPWLRPKSGHAIFRSRFWRAPKRIRFWKKSSFSELRDEALMGLLSRLLKGATLFLPIFDYFRALKLSAGPIASSPLKGPTRPFSLFRRILSI
jgi:hypothetical protein